VRDRNSERAQTDESKRAKPQHDGQHLATHMPLARLVFGRLFPKIFGTVNRRLALY
jgi:hypothetical protein